MKNGIDPDGIFWQSSNTGLPIPSADSPPNAAWVNDPPVVSDKYLESGTFLIFEALWAQLTFRHNYVEFFTEILGQGIEFPESRLTLSGCFRQTGSITEHFDADGSLVGSKCTSSVPGFLGHRCAAVLGTSESPP